mgnify:FL=1
MRNSYILLCCLFVLLSACREEQPRKLTPKEQLGKLIFFDTALSNPPGQSCATCHTPANGFADTLSRPISEGAVKGLFSNRNSMTIC